MPTGLCVCVIGYSVGNIAEERGSDRCVCVCVRERESET